ncbi:MAG: hypothetical protein PHE36_15095 [Novosphingobium sp.]|nr:hypothetical protein [Novosphingobium sp.]
MVGELAVTSIVVGDRGCDALAPIDQIATEPLPRAVMDEVNPGRRMISDSQGELFYTRPSPDGTRILFGTRPSVLSIGESKAAVRMATRLQSVWPQLAPFGIMHSWRGKVAMTFDRIAHMGRRGRHPLRGRL